MINHEVEGVTILYVDDEGNELEPVKISLDDVESFDGGSLAWSRTVKAIEVDPTRAERVLLPCLDANLKVVEEFLRTIGTGDTQLRGDGMRYAYYVRQALDLLFPGWRDA